MTITPSQIRRIAVVGQAVKQEEARHPGQPEEHALESQDKKIH